MTLQLAIILICLFYGARKGGLALGLLGGTGIVLMVFAFHLPPGKPPVEVMLTIVAVVAASATLQASGGLEVMLQLAEKVLRRNPKYVSILAPFTTCFLTMLCGTGHVVYTMLPIIAPFFQDYGAAVLDADALLKRGKSIKIIVQLYEHACQSERMI
jgi:anaerobic C4-dicarboxylate transporter DcuB